MEPTSPSTLSRIRRYTLPTVGAALVALGVSACASGPPELPDPRPIVIRSGARLHPEKERMKAIDEWFRAEQENIEQDPTFWIEIVPRDTPAYPWESLYLNQDTAKIGLERGKSPQAQYIYSTYAHLHLMYTMGRLEEFLPEAPFVEDYDRERAIMEKVADSWLYARSVYEAEPYDLLEEITYANEAGYLDALILTARGEEFAAERRAWLEENPEGLEEYRTWFVENFSQEPPGLRDEG